MQFGQAGGVRIGRNLDHDVQQELTRLNKLISFCQDELDVKKQPLNLLELGIGFTLVTTAIAHSFKPEEIKIYGLEHPDRDELQDPKFLNHLANTGVNLDKSDMCQFPWPYSDNLFNIVVFSETIEHVTPTVVPKILQEIARILKPEGIAIISTPNLGAWQYRSKLLRGKAIFDEAIPIEWAGGTYGHIRLYTVKEIAALCRRYGLEQYWSEYLDYGLINKSTAIKRWLYRTVYQLFPALSPEFFVLVRKQK